MTQYAAIADLFVYGMPATAQGSLDDDALNAALGAASVKVDTYLRGRFQLPLVAWGLEVTEATCRIAAYDLLNVRGYNPAAGADTNIRDRYVDALDWLDRVQRRAAHPNVTETAGPAADYAQPVVISSSVTTMGGRVAANRGW